ncbi:hypothetical protein ABK040_001722 [Willaertia magna]
MMTNDILQVEDSRKKKINSQFSFKNYLVYGIVALFIIQLIVVLYLIYFKKSSPTTTVNTTNTSTTQSNNKKKKHFNYLNNNDNYQAFQNVKKRELSKIKLLTTTIWNRSEKLFTIGLLQSIFRAYPFTNNNFDFLDIKEWIRKDLSNIVNDETIINNDNDILFEKSLNSLVNDIINGLLFSTKTSTCLHPHEFNGKSSYHIRCGLTNQFYELNLCFSILSIYNRMTPIYGQLSYSSIKNNKELDIEIDDKQLSGHTKQEEQDEEKITNKFEDHYKYYNYLPIPTILEPELCVNGTFGLCVCYNTKPYSSVFNYKEAFNYLEDNVVSDSITTDFLNVLNDEENNKKVPYMVDNDFNAMKANRKELLKLYSRRKFYLSKNKIMILKKKEYLELKCMRNKLISKIKKWKDELLKEKNLIKKVLKINEKSKGKEVLVLLLKRQLFWQNKNNPHLDLIGEWFINLSKQLYNECDAKISKNSPEEYSLTELDFVPQLFSIINAKYRYTLEEITNDYLHPLFTNSILKRGSTDDIHNRIVNIGPVYGRYVPLFHTDVEIYSKLYLKLLNLNEKEETRKNEYKRCNGNYLNKPSCASDHIDFAQRAGDRRWPIPTQYHIDYKRRFAFSFPHYKVGAGVFVPRCSEIKFS